MQPVVLHCTHHGKGFTRPTLISLLVGYTAIRLQVHEHCCETASPALQPHSSFTACGMRQMTHHVGLCSRPGLAWFFLVKSILLASLSVRCGTSVTRGAYIWRWAVRPSHVVLLIQAELRINFLPCCIYLHNPHLCCKPYADHESVA